MAADLNRILQAAAKAVLEDQAPDSGGRSSKKSKGLTAPRALLIGAGVFTAGRLLVRGRANGLVEGIQQRLADFTDQDAEGYDEGEEDFDEEDFDEDEPYDEARDEPEDDYEEEPEGEYDEEEPEEGYDEEPEDEPEAEADDEDEAAAEDEDEEPEQERPRRRSRSTSSRSS
jgi:hypothetical protein